MQAIRLHYCYLRNKLTTHWPVTNNHLIVELTACLVYEIVSKKKSSRNAGHWELLEREIDKQIYYDGVIREQATGYMRFNLDAFLLLLALCGQMGKPGPQFLVAATSRMLEFTRGILQPDGTIPQIGDSDEGHVVPPASGRDFWDFGGHLALGSLLCKRPDFKIPGLTFDNDLACLLQPGLKERFSAQKEVALDTGGRLFPSGGYWTWRSTNREDHLVFRAGDFGLGGEGYCPHSHCDELSVILSLGGRPILVDCGTYTYDAANKNWRDHFRENSAHNIVQVDGHLQAEHKPLGTYSWKRIPRVQILKSDENYCEARLEDYLERYHWRRSIRPESGRVEITDEIVFADKEMHDLKWFFNLHPLFNARIEEGAVRMASGHRSFSLRAKSSVESFQWKIENGRYSEHYNQYRDHTRIILEATSRTPCRMRLTIQ